MAIKRVKCRAKIEFVGANLTVRTPFVQSFNVTKTRAAASSFDASLKIPSNQIADSIISSEVSIYAGSITGTDSVGGSLSTLPKIFTGYVRQAKISPCYDDPDYVILSISGSDALSLLQGKKYTRRCRSTASNFVSITGVTRKGLKSGKFTRATEPIVEMDDGELNQDLPVTQTRDLGPESKQISKTPSKAVAPLITVPVGD